MDEKKTLILGVGSMGCTTVVQWIKNKYIDDENNEIYLVHNDSRSLIKYHNEIKNDIREWCLDISDLFYSDKEDRQYQAEALKEYICAWMSRFARVKRIILVTGLGKTMGSIAVPLILDASKTLGIETVTMCVTPFAFEGDISQKRSEMILPLIKQLSTVTYYSDNNDLEIMSEESLRTMPEILDMVNYGFAFVVNSIQKEDILQKYVCRMYIRKDETTGDIHFDQEAVYDNALDVISVVCKIVDTWVNKADGKVNPINFEDNLVRKEKETLLKQYRLQQLKHQENEKISINPKLIGEKQNVLCAIMGFVLGRGYVADNKFEESILNYVLNRNLADNELMEEACTIIDTAVNRKWLYGKRFDAVAAVVNGCDFKTAI